MGVCVGGWGNQGGSYRVSVGPPALSQAFTIGRVRGGYVDSGSGSQCLSNDPYKQSLIGELWHAEDAAGARKD